MYVTELLLIFVRVPAPEAGERFQVTPLLAESFWTAAVKVSEPPATIVAVAGEIETAVEGTVMVTELDFDASAVEVAVIVTVPVAAGALVGAA